MRRWFLSYHSPDQVLAARLKDAIERSDSDSRVFFAPTSLRAGGSWTAQLAQELTEADVFIFLVGEAGVGSWQVPEYDEALDRWVKSGRTFPLIVILLEGQKAPGLPFLHQLHWIVTADPTAEKDLGRLFDAASGHGGRLDGLWRFTSPYRGLEAMEERDSDYFFGRSRETVEALDALAAPDRMPVLIGNSGVGKSSLAQAGVLAALKRQAWPEQAHKQNGWPQLFQDSRRWCYLSLKPGTEPVKALVEAFVDTWQFAATDPVRSDHQRGWIERLRDGKATLPDLIEATERRRAELDQAKPPAFFLYVDQGEELYVRAEEGQRRRFSQLLVEALADPRLRTMMSMRADFLGDLQSDKPLFKARYQIDVPPLGEDELRDVVSRPAERLGARFEPDGLIDIITRRTVEDSIKEVGALPLLSYTLDDMWREMTRHGDGLLRLPAQSFELGGVLVGRANRFLAEHRGAEDALRRIFTLRLATVREDGEPTRRRALRGEFSEEEWRFVSDLADYPNRLLVTATTDAGDTYAEVAHEAIFRRWGMLRQWIAAEREFLAWHYRLEMARSAYEKTSEASKPEALLMGLALDQAEDWFAKRSEDLPAPDREFIVQSITRDKTTKARARRQKIIGYSAVAFAIISLLVTSLAMFAFHEQAAAMQERAAAETAVERSIIANLRTATVISPDGSRLLALDPNGEVNVFDLSSGQQLGVISVPGGQITSVDFSPDGRRIATADTTETVRIWDAASFHAIMTLQGATAEVRRVAFSPDGTMIASGGDDEVARVWSVTTGEMLYAVHVPAAVAALAFSPGGQLLVVSTVDGRFQIFDSRTGQSPNRSSH